MAELETLLWVPAIIITGGTVAMIAHNLIKEYRLSKQEENQTKESHERFNKLIYETTRYLGQRR